MQTNVHIIKALFVFTESALRPIQSIGRDVRLSVCFSHLGNKASRWTRDLWLKGVPLILGFKKSFFCLPKLLNNFALSKNLVFALAVYVSHM